MPPVVHVGMTVVRKSPSAHAGKTVAVMQPYFFPYAGYFRLFAQSDEFILFDSAQFARRGRTHRCQVPGPHSTPEWLTLPLRSQPQDTRICDLEFASDARSAMDQRLARLPWFRDAAGPASELVREFLQAPLGSVIDYLEGSLRLVLQVLELEARIRRSSSLQIDPGLRGQERIIAICHAVGATRYLNAPGGRGLYNEAVFADNGIELAFLPDYRGPHVHLLPALMRCAPCELREDVVGGSLDRDGID